MKVKCISNSGKSLSKKALILGDTAETEFELEIGRKYVVYGICIWNELLNYLIVGQEASLPSWYPAELFVVIDHLLPIEWYFNYTETSSVSALWGYRELVLENKHYDDLIERKSDAIKVFLKRKEEIDEV